MKREAQVNSFPNGWFCVAYSEQIKPGEAIPLHYFGKDLVLFRTEKGVPHVFDAHCPHLGAHLGYGGKVKDETIHCPFHGWCYDSNGKCTSVPYNNELPPNVQLQKWSTKEVNGIIIVYHGSKGRPPAWEVPNLDELVEHDDVVFQLIKRQTLHIQPPEVGEHSYDIDHVNLHNQASKAKSKDLKFDGATAIHHFSIEYKPLVPASWLIGKEVTLSSEVKNYGLGVSLITHALEGKIKGYWLVMVLTTPVDEEHSEVHFLLGMPKVFNRLINPILERFLCQEMKKGVELEISFLENKTHYSYPPLRNSDESIAQFREWASQFYSEGSF